MKYNELIIGRNKAKNRVGRGISAGQGKTAGRGTKGQGARKSSNVRPGFEGGQMPLYMRVPKLRGFKSKRTPAEVVYTGQLNDIKKAAVDNVVLAEAGLVSSPFVNVKLISKGELTTKKEVKLQAASAKAIEAIEKSGGSFTVVSRLARTSKEDNKKESK
jgi:large subunit ribosomal protein L15